MTRISLSQEQWYRLRLIRTRNIGPATYYQLLHQHASAEQALQWLEEHKRQSITLHPMRDIEAEVDALDRLGGQLLWHDDSCYPALLRHIPHAPPVLSVMGKLTTLEATPVAIVGARNASHSGLYMAEKLAKDLSERGIAIVSGMARGVDSAAHQATLDTESTVGTVAILAGGIDKPFPAENYQLYQKIIAGGGLLVSEMPLGTEPQSRLFPRRNRVIAGLSRLCIVIEASAQSGSMITASLAADYGREVGVVPGSPLDSRNAGSLNLLRQGAQVISCAQDACDILDDLAGTSMAEATPHMHDETLQATPVFDQQQIRTAQQEILAFLSVDPCPVDHIINTLHYSAALVLACISELELNAEVVFHWDNRVLRLFPQHIDEADEFLDTATLERQDIEAQALLASGNPAVYMR